MARHVSAANLRSLDPPTLINHNKLHPADRKIWDQAYEEEYEGLQQLPTWVSLDQHEFDKITHTVSGILPTMAISTIKYNADGHPTRAKYCIVALGNMDRTVWSKSECYAPVISLPEMRLLISLAIRTEVIPKSGDVVQAFCQQKLPKHERYVLKPPHGDTRTPPNTYWLLLRTLYGLKRSPHHWYNLVVKLFKQFSSID